MVIFNVSSELVTVSSISLCIMKSCYLATSIITRSLTFSLTIILLMKWIVCLVAYMLLILKWWWHFAHEFRVIVKGTLCFILKEREANRGQVQPTTLTSLFPLCYDGGHRNFVIIQCSPIDLRRVWFLLVRDYKCTYDAIPSSLDLINLTIWQVMTRIFKIF